MRSVAGGADECVGGVASAPWSLADVPGNAFDDNSDTFWHYGATGGVEVHLSYDFGRLVDVAEVYVRLPSASSGRPGNTYGPQQLRLGFSDDGSTWFPTRYGVYTGNVGNAAEVVVPAGDDSPTAKSLGGLGRLAGSTPTGLNWKVGPSAPIRLMDTYLGGRGRVFGTVMERASPSNVPLARRVRLHREVDGRLVGETVSDPVTGAYEFTNIDETQTYTVISYDYARNYRAVVADNLTPSLMP
jgi:hypothetical protein